MGASGRAQNLDALGRRGLAGDIAGVELGQVLVAGGDDALSAAALALLRQPQLRPERQTAESASRQRFRRDMPWRCMGSDPQGLTHADPLQRACTARKPADTTWKNNNIIANQGQSVNWKNLFAAGDEALSSSRAHMRADSEEVVGASRDAVGCIGARTVRFYLRTFEGTHAHTAREEALGNGSDRLAPLFARAQDALTEIRLQEKRSRRRGPSAVHRLHQCITADA